MAVRAYVQYWFIVLCQFRVWKTQFLILNSSVWPICQLPQIQLCKKKNILDLLNTTYNWSNIYKINYRSCRKINNLSFFPKKCEKMNFHILHLPHKCYYSLGTLSSLFSPKKWYIYIYKKVTPLASWWLWKITQKDSAIYG